MYQTIILGFILLVTLNFLKRFRDPKLNMPPLIPYKIPIIGHTISYMTNTERFFEQCREEYGDIFSIYIWGEVKTFVGKEHTHEILTKDNIFDFRAAADRKIPSSLLFKNLGSTDSAVKELKEYILNKLEFYTERMQKNLYLATQNYIGDCDEPKTIYNISSFMKEIISTPIANILVGEEIAKYDDIIITFSNLTLDVAKLLIIPPILDFIYPGLQNYINRILSRLGLFNPTAKHRRILSKHIKNQIEKRFQEKQKYGNSWKRPNDLLQDYMDQKSFNADDNTYEIIIDKLCLYIFVSVYTTSRSCANAILNLASRPEYMQELYEEQLEVHKQADENGILPFEALDEMKKLDCFIRESLRISESAVGLFHIVLKDYTFSNGLQVPEGHEVGIYADDTTQDESLQGPNPKSFEPFRHLNKDVSAPKIDKSNLAFGNGKHACPGRYFATNEIKFFLHNAILRYNFRTESGKVEKIHKFGSVSLASGNGIIFEKRI